MNEEIPNNVSFNGMFEKPSGLGHIKIEYIYNLMFGKFPSRLYIQDPLDIVKTLAYIQENFERLSVDYAFRNNNLHETAFWRGVGKYSDVVLEVTESKHTKFGDHLSELVDEIYGESQENSDMAKNEITTCKVNVASSDPEKLKDLCSDLSKHVAKRASKIHLLTNSYGDVVLQPIDITPSTVDLELNYGKKFVDIHDEIISSLNNKLSGLYLFYGDPGTGKSSYIKYLLNSVTTRKIVYVPINLIDSLISPDFLPLLISNRNLILVIEDAEKALLSREENTGNSSIVSAILNLTDSFIGNALNVTIIATFNTKKDNIDKALLRKGRLKLSHEFKKLEKEEAQKLIDSLKFDYTATEPMSLAEIYYLYEDNKFKEDRDKDRIVGFGKA
jgi:predicted AAA+ superfamily ATPase